ncbi:hypothetical protein SAMN05192560_2291 [Methylobacillus rhizosphaerae]|uniref:Heat induced stress protein YflT n=1 Tax=Methylobacillus rhizosphaerae TaxID=551994 RepID=A0A239B4X6_9PROT|nr:hypothetical protein [Methylobacillus rhizosphaerae]SNS02889.1 hypothetical protein SAMN05192560_2291 [Methylobacillus rhizosphaerae]
MTLESVTGIYPAIDDAHQVAQQLIDRGIPHEHIQVVSTRTDGHHVSQVENNGEVLKNVILDSAVGTTIGAGVGALGEIALVAANVSLFVASPLIAPLVMIGWGAVVGGFIGAANGISNHERDFSDLLADAITQGHVVLLVDAETEEEVEIARAIIAASMQVDASQDR